MISYVSYNSNWKFTNARKFNSRLKKFISSNSYELQQISYFFGSDEWLLGINIETFEHDYYTDIVTIDYSTANLLHIDMFISLDRVKDNALKLNLSFDQELYRVMIHGVLHCMGFDDHSKDDIHLIREKESEFLQLF